MLINPMSN